MEQGLREMLSAWVADADRDAAGHRRACRRLDRMHYIIGIPTVVVSSVVASTVFASLGATVEPWAKIAVGSVSVIGAVLAGVQTFLRFGGRAEQHRAAQVELERFLREGQMLLSLPPVDGAALSDRIAKLNEQLGEVQRNAPPIATRDYQARSFQANSALGEVSQTK